MFNWPFQGHGMSLNSEVVIIICLHFFTRTAQVSRRKTRHVPNETIAYPSINALLNVEYCQVIECLMFQHLKAAECRGTLLE